MAAKAYDRLNAYILAAYTGSSGVHLPQDVQEYLEGLRRLRQGAPGRFPRSEILQQSGMRPRSFCPENRMTCDCKVDRFILPRGWLSKGL